MELFLFSLKNKKVFFKSYIKAANQAIERNTNVVYYDYTNFYCEIEQPKGELRPYSTSKENRYSRLIDKVMKADVKTKVLMLSAIPVNNQFYDLPNHLALTYSGDSAEFDEKLRRKAKNHTTY